MDGMRKYPEPWIGSSGDVVRKKPTMGPWDFGTLFRRKWGGQGSIGRNPQGGNVPKSPSPKPKEKSEIDLYLERIGYDDRR